MAEQFYRVIVPEDARLDLVEGKDTLIISAETSAEAILTAKAYLHLPSDAAWASSTPVVLAHDADLEGWRLKVTITDTDGTTITATATVTAASGDDFDAIGDLMVIALNADDDIAGAAYSTPNLKIAETTDGLGDQTVTMQFLPPITWDDPTIDFPEFFGTLVHEGVSGDALTLVLKDVVAPTVMYQLGSGH